jgi:hypothetical protein
VPADAEALPQVARQRPHVGARRAGHEDVEVDDRQAVVHGLAAGEHVEASTVTGRGASSTVSPP